MGPKKIEKEKPNHFKEGDLVMAADTNFTSGGALYSARIIRAHKVDVGLFKYLVHYNGWKRRYDVWMEPAHLALVGDTVAVEKLQELQEKLTKGKKGKGKGAASAGAASTDTSSSHDATVGVDGEAEVGKKRSTEQDLLEEDRNIKKNKAVLSASDLVEEREDDVLAMADMDLPIALKKKLVNEWSLISEKEPRRLIRLPRTMTVRKIIDEYLEFKKMKEKLGKDEIKEVSEFCESLVIYFDRALPVILLYRHERKQYDNAAKYMEQKHHSSSSSSGNGRTLMPSDVYGGEHLNRLFVRLAKMLTGVVVKHEELTAFKSNIADFLKFFSKNASLYCVDEDYRGASEALAVGGIVVTDIIDDSGSSTTQEENPIVPVALATGSKVKSHKAKGK